MNDKKSWHWFVQGFMYRAEHQDTPSLNEAKKKFFEEYDKWVDKTITPSGSSIIDLCKKDTETYGFEAD